MLSHHPNCERFEVHTIKVGEKRFCIGCFIGYPIAIFGVIFFPFLNLTKILSSQLLFLIGVILMSSFLLSPLKLTRRKAIKIIQKVLFNLGGAFLFWWIFTLPNPFLINFLLFFLIFGSALTIVNAYHAYSFYKTCKKCEYSLEWERCPGFKELFEHCERNHLPNLFKIGREQSIE
jgi:hypothetical protein